jgi:hypothetical protein
MLIEFAHRVSSYRRKNNTFLASITTLTTCRNQFAPDKPLHQS